MIFSCILRGLLNDDGHEKRRYDLLGSGGGSSIAELDLEYREMRSDAGSSLLSIGAVIHASLLTTLSLGDDADQTDDRVSHPQGNPARAMN